MCSARGDAGNSDCSEMIETDAPVLISIVRGFTLTSISAVNGWVQGSSNLEVQSVVSSGHLLETMFGSCILVSTKCVWAAPLVVYGCQNCFFGMTGRCDMAFLFAVVTSGITKHAVYLIVIGFTTTVTGTAGRIIRRFRAVSWCTWRYLNLMYCGIRSLESFNIAVSCFHALGNVHDFLEQ